MEIDKVVRNVYPARDELVFVIIGNAGGPVMVVEPRFHP